MRVSPPPEEVRELVVRTFEEFAVTHFSMSAMKETILIDNGCYVARSYRAGGFMAMWLVGVGIVQFYDADGNMLRTINLLRELEPQRMMAA